MGENTYYKEVLYALLVLGGLGAFLGSRDKLRNGFLLFVCLLGLGYRTYPVTQVLRIIPAELVLCLLPFLSPANPENSAPGRLPRWVLLMIPFWLLAWLPSSERTWDERFSEFRNFVLLIPLYLSAPRVLATISGWRAVVLALTGVSVWISAMGLLEHLVPSVATALPGFMGNPNPFDAGGFQRASFSFYGSPIAVFICVMVLPLSLVSWQWWPTPKARIATVLGAILQLAAIYISGYRSIWLLAALQFGVIVLMKRQIVLGVLAVAVAFAGYQALPKETQDRLHSLGSVLQGRPDAVDTSGKKRWDRAQDSLAFAFEQPTGHGWAVSGWVHSDFLQVAANQGIVPGAIFLGAYLLTAIRLGRRTLVKTLPPDLAALPFPLFLSFVAVGGILLYEGVEFLPQTMLPVWLMWSLVDTLLWQTPTQVAAGASQMPAEEGKEAAG
jgi:hypothetical protein